MPPWRFFHHRKGNITRPRGGTRRIDLALSAYAIALGFTVCGHMSVPLTPDLFDDDGIPRESLQFTIGDIMIWETARGWRVGRLVDAHFLPPQDADFFQSLKLALDEGNRNWRDR